MAVGASGVDVLVKIGSGVTSAILGQRGATMTSTREAIDMTTKTNWPSKTYDYGWADATIDCDGLLMVNGTGGFADLLGMQLDGTVVDVEVTLGDGGETVTGSAIMTEVSFSAPQDGEGTMACKLQCRGTLTPTEGV